MRNRTVGSKVTEGEYEMLAARAAQEGQRLGEWARAVLLERAEGRPPSVIEESLLAEVLGLRTILLNAFYKLAQGEKLGAEEMQALIARADGEKQQKAQKRLKEIQRTQAAGEGERCLNKGSRNTWANS